MAPYKYYVSHTCPRCKHEDYFETSKREAAFMLVNPASFNNIPCTKCGYNQFNVWGYSMCKLDKELFIEWANNPDLFF